MLIYIHSSEVRSCIAHLQAFRTPKKLSRQGSLAAPCFEHKLRAGAGPPPALQLILSCLIWEVRAMDASRPVHACFAVWTALAAAPAEQPASIPELAEAKPDEAVAALQDLLTPGAESRLTEDASPFVSGHPDKPPFCHDR